MHIKMSKAISAAVISPGTAHKALGAFCFQIVGRGDTYRQAPSASDAFVMQISASGTTLTTRRLSS